MSPDMTTQTFNGVEANTQTSRPVSYQAQTPYAMNPNAYGQVYTPYYSAAVPSFAPPPQQQQMLGVPTQPMPPFSDAKRPPETKAWATSKDVLHAIGIIIAIVCFGLSLATIGYGDAAIAAYGNAPIAGLAFAWSGAELITRLVRKREAGIHPGAHVALNLIIWLGAAILTGLCGAFLGFDEYDGYYCEYNYDNPDDCEDHWYGRWGIFLASEVFIGLIWLLYFVLFVLACIDTARRNRWNGRKVIYVPQPAWGGMPANGGWQKMDQYGGAPAQQGVQQQGQYQAVGQGQGQGQAPPMMQTYQPQGNEYLGAAGELNRQRDLEHGVPLQDRTPSPATADRESGADKGKGRVTSPAAEEMGEASSSSRLGGGSAAPRADVVEYYTPQP